MRKTLDINDVGMLIRFPSQNVCFRYNMKEHDISRKSEDPKEWDMLDMINPRHRFTVRSPESQEIEFLFSEYWIVKNSGLRRIERVIRMSEKKRLPVKFKDIAKLMELTKGGH